MAPVRLSDDVRRQLREALVDEQFLLELVQVREPQEVPGQPGRRKGSYLAPIRRPLDPETAEMRKIRVFLREVDEGWEIYQVEGLDFDLEG